MYFEFLFLRAHSRRRVERRYWSGVSLNSRTTCSNSVMVGVTGPIGSGLPQLGLPRRFAIELLFLCDEIPDAGCCEMGICLPFCVRRFDRQIVLVGSHSAVSYAFAIIRWGPKALSLTEKHTILRRNKVQNQRKIRFSGNSVPKIYQGLYLEQNVMSFVFNLLRESLDDFLAETTLMRSVSMTKGR